MHVLDVISDIASLNDRPKTEIWNYFFLWENNSSLWLHTRESWLKIFIFGLVISYIGSLTLACGSYDVGPLLH